MDAAVLLSPCCQPRDFCCDFSICRRRRCISCDWAMFAPRHTGRLPPSVSDRTRRTVVDCRWPAAPAAARVPATVALSRRGARHPRGLTEPSTLAPDEESWSRGELTVLSLPIIVGDDVRGLVGRSQTPAGERG